jgi:hypothetical protein
MSLKIKSTKVRGICEKRDDMENKTNDKSTTVEIWLENLVTNPNSKQNNLGYCTDFSNLLSFFCLPLSVLRFTASNYPFGCIINN